MMDSTTQGKGAMATHLPADKPMLLSPTIAFYQTNCSDSIPAIEDLSGYLAEIPATAAALNGTYVPHGIFKTVE